MAQSAHLTVMINAVRKAARGVQRVGRTGQPGTDDEAVGAKDFHAAQVRRLRGASTVRLRSTAVAEWVSAPMLITSTPGTA